MQPGHELLRVDGVSKAFPGILANDAVTFDLRAGEIHALVGENGAGKTTLMGLLFGIHQPDRGRILVDGAEIALDSPRAAILHGIGFVQQHYSLIPTLTVLDNIVLSQRYGGARALSRAAIAAKVRGLAERHALAVDLHAVVERLSVGEQQRVELIKALIGDPRILILDEPAALLSAEEVTRLWRILRDLAANGAGIILIGHKLEEVLAIADRVTVLRDGKVAAAGEPMVEMTRQRLVSLMIGREERVARLGDRTVDRAQVALEARNLSTSLGHRDVTLQLHRGEILGLYGLVGAGRSELARAFLGDGAITAGELIVRGKPTRIRDMDEALNRHRIGYISEDRKQEGLILMHSIQSNVAITIWNRLAGFLGLLGSGKERRAVAPFARRLEIRAPSLDRAVSNLSGGNQQKVSIAKWLAANAEILIVDEPTVGIDIKTKTYIHELLGEIARDGVSVLLISSDMPEMIAVADRILVMHGFRIVGEVANDHRYETVSKAIMSRIHAVEDVETAAAE